MKKYLWWVVAGVAVFVLFFVKKDEKKARTLDLENVDFKRGVTNGRLS